MGNWDSKIELDPTFWMAECFSNEEEFWESGERDFREIVSGFPIDWLQDAKVLEVGCGVGRILRAAKQSVGRLVGLDSSPASLVKAAQYLEGLSIPLLLVSGARLNVESQKFDLIYSFGTFGHLSPKILVNYLFDINNLLENNGKAVLQLYVGNEVLFSLNDTYSLRSYDRNRLESTCRKLGFEIVSIEPCRLPYDAVDMKLGRSPILLRLSRVSASMALNEIWVQSLVSAQEPEYDPVGSKDEFQMAITKSKKLIDQGEFVKAERFFLHAIKIYKNIDADTLLAYDVLKKYLEEIKI